MTDKQEKNLIGWYLFGCYTTVFLMAVFFHGLGFFAGIGVAFSVTWCIPFLRNQFFIA